MYDIARVEALAGPQGTLYGASSQSGTIRIITNKPDKSGFDGGYSLEGNTIADGDPGYLAEGFANIPLGESAAIRLVGWVRHDGGYIDNVAATRTFPTSGISHEFTGRRQLQRRRHLWRARRAQDRPQRQLEHHAQRDVPESEGQRHLRRRERHRRSRGRALASGEHRRPVGAGRAHRRRQDQQFRHHVRELVSQARRGRELRLLGLLVLLRHAGAGYFGTYFTRQRRRAHQSVAVHPGQGRLHQDQQRTALLDVGGEPLAFRRRPVRAAPDARHPAGLHRSPGWRTTPM